MSANRRRSRPVESGSVAARVVDSNDVPEDISDDALTRLALAADPDPRLDDAVPIWQLLGEPQDAALPQWYMPSPMPRPRAVRGWRRRAIVLVVASFLAIDAYGLCNTYGDLAPHSSDAPAQVAPPAP
jgi:hypothetical protein